MAALRQQTNYNNEEEFGGIDDGSLHQSLYFNRPFTLDSVTVRFDSTTVDPVQDLKVRCEVRAAVGPDNLVDIREDPIDESAWYDDHSIPPTEFTFTMNSLVFDAGFYWFSFVVDTIDDSSFLLAVQKTEGGTFLGKFIKIHNEVGVYRQDTSLMIVSAGSWNEPQGRSDVYEHNEFVATSIQDRE